MFATPVLWLGPHSDFPPQIPQIDENAAGLKWFADEIKPELEPLNAVPPRPTTGKASTDRRSWRKSDDPGDGAIPAVSGRELS